MKPQLVRVTRTIRQTYYVRVDNAATKVAAAKAAVELVEDWGDTNGPGREVSPWHMSTRDLDTAEPFGGVHDTIDLDPEGA